MHDTWKDMFVLGLPLAEKILRPIFVYAFLVISLRLSGKRELVQLNPFDWWCCSRFPIPCRTPSLATTIPLPAD